MIHKLLFLNPTWHYGFNATVRLGDKWANTSSVGDTVELVRTGDEEKVLASGTISKIEYLPFEQIPIWVLVTEHDRECSTYQGLAFAMLKAYPEFRLNSSVTVLTFCVVK